MQITFFLGLMLAMLFQDTQSESVEVAAQKAFDKGQQAVLAGKTKQAITHLETAVRLNPKAANYRFLLAKAYKKSEQYAPMWTQIQLAANLKPSDPAIANEFFQFWMFHDRQGLMNVGTPQSQVLKTLGKPANQMGDEDHGRLIYGYLAVDTTRGRVSKVVDLRGLTEEMAVPNQTLQTKLDRNQWKIAHRFLKKSDDNIEFVPKNETVQNWTEMYSEQRFPLVSRTAATPRSMMDNMKANLKKMFPDMVWEIISESPESIVYHWRIKGNDQFKAQHEIARIIKGERDFFRIAYVKRTPELSEETANQYATIIRSARLKSSGSERIDAKLASRMAWETGRNLSMAAIMNVNQAPDETVKGYLDTAVKFSRPLGLKIPELPATSNDRTKDQSTALMFLLNDTGKPFHNHIKKSQGNQAAAYYEMGTKSSLLMMMYVPDDSAGKSLGQAISRAASVAKIPSELQEELQQKIDSGVPHKELVAAVLKFHKAIGQHLLKQP